MSLSSLDNALSETISWRQLTLAEITVVNFDGVLMSMERDLWRLMPTRRYSEQLVEILQRVDSRATDFYYAIYFNKVAFELKRRNTSTFQLVDCITALFRSGKLVETFPVSSSPHPQTWECNVNFETTNVLPSYTSGCPFFLDASFLMVTGSLTSNASLTLLMQELSKFYLQLSLTCDSVVNVSTKLRTTFYTCIWHVCYAAPDSIGQPLHIALPR